jgi:hypothetical protein
LTVKSGNPEKLRTTEPLRTLRKTKGTSARPDRVKGILIGMKEIPGTDRDVYGRGTVEFRAKYG